MKIHRETTLSLPEPFYEVLERQLASEVPLLGANHTATTVNTTAAE